MWDHPGPGLEPVSPALAGGFLTTAPPGKPDFTGFYMHAFVFFLFFFFNKFIYFIYIFLAVLGLRCCVRAFSSCGERGLLFVAVRRLLIAVASLVVEHGL